MKPLINVKPVVLFITFSVLIFILLFPASADMGPKPSVNVNAEGIDEECYITLLSKNGPTGPYLAREYRESWGPKNAWNAFENFADEDGYTFGYFMEKLEDGKYIMGYYPPDEFKVLIYFPKRNVYIISQAFERVRFDTYIRMTVNAEEASLAMMNSENRVYEVEAEEYYEYADELHSLVLRIILTVALEVGVAFLFGYRGKQFIIIGITNALTQIVLNIGLFHIDMRYGDIYMVLNYVMLEIAVILIECIVYSKTLYLLGNPEKRDHPCAYAIVANILSFAAGLALSVVLPKIF